MSNDDLVPGFDDEQDQTLRIRLQGVESVPGCLVFFLSGSIDMYSSRAFTARVGKAIAAGYIRLIFHLREVRFIDSSGSGAFIGFLREVRPRGGDVVFVEILPKLYEVYRLLGWQQYLYAKESLEEAVALFAGRH